MHLTRGMHWQTMRVRQAADPQTLYGVQKEQPRQNVARQPERLSTGDEREGESEGKECDRKEGVVA